MGVFIKNLTLTQQYGNQWTFPWILQNPDWCTEVCDIIFSKKMENQWKEKKIPEKTP